MHALFQMDPYADLRERVIQRLVDEERKQIAMKQQYEADQVVFNRRCPWYFIICMLITLLLIPYNPAVAFLFGFCSFFFLYCVYFNVQF